MEIAIENALALAEMRRSRGVTQKQLAETMHVSQANISRIEHGEDAQLSTIQRYISALGGHLSSAPYSRTALSSCRQVMSSAEQASALALALTGAEEKAHFGNVDFRVRNKVFASFSAPDTMTLKLDPEHARILVEADPETYALHPGSWGQRGWIRVMLSRIGPDDLADLIHESWSRVAPKRNELSN